MRPRRQILMFGDRESDTAVLAFALCTVTHSAVRYTSDPRVFRAVLCSQPWDAVLILDHGRHRLTQRLAATASEHFPTMVLARKEALPPFSPAHISLSLGAPVAEIIERLRVLPARKRGPRKGSKRAALAEVA